MTRIIFLIVLFVPLSVHAAGLTLGPQSEITQPGQGHELQISGAALAVTRESEVFVTWARQDAQVNNLYLAHIDTEGTRTVRVNPEGLAVDSLHQSPGIAVGPRGEVYLSWSSAKPKPEGALFASDLRLSCSLDGGRSFDFPLQVNEDRPISHSFEGLAVAGDGTVLVSWIDSREGWDKASTYLARIGERGAEVKTVVTLDGNTCVCCRSALATGPKSIVAALWRKVLPGDIRDMAFSLSRDGGQSFTPATVVHADHWQFNACPHRGGGVALDAHGQLYVIWYTEGEQGRPKVLFARSSDAQRFAPPQRLDISTGSIPDYARIAVDASERIGIVWEEATAVRRSVVLRYSTDGGKTFSPAQTLSHVLKAYASDIAASPAGGFMVVWHEEQFPQLKTIIQTIRIGNSL